MRQILQMPFGAPPPDTDEDVFERAVKAAVSDAVSRAAQVRVADWAMGCAGAPVVSIGQATDCHAIAAPGQAGAKKYLSATPFGLAGNVLQVGPLMGRAFAGNAAYSSGAGGGSVSGAGPSDVSTSAKVVIPVDMIQPGLSLGGSVLLAGGEPSGPPTASCERFRVASWAATGAMSNTRSEHTQVLISHGKVLACGGKSTSFAPTATAEVFDDAAGTWSSTGSLATARARAVGVLLLDGRVLVCGGYGPGGASADVLKSAEVYDPTAGTWSSAGNMSARRWGHTATLLEDGTVLVAGGAPNNSDPTSDTFKADIYDPGSNTWSATGSLAFGRFWHTAARLPDGKVLVAGGVDGTGATGSTALCELYDPAAGTWSATGSLSTDRQWHADLLLPSGKVLVAGGLKGSTSQVSCELYTPASGTWAATGSLGTARYRCELLLLDTGKVMVVGSNSVAAGCELYDPAAGTWSATGSLGTARKLPRATLLGRTAPGGILAADLVVTSTAPTLVSGARRRTITIAWAYAGGSPAYAVQLKATLALGWTFVSATGGGTVLAGVVTWNLGDLAPAATGTVSVTISY